MSPAVSITLTIVVLLVAGAAGFYFRRGLGKFSRYLFGDLPQTQFGITYILFGILLAEILGFGLVQFLSVRPGEELYALPDLRRAYNQAQSEGKEFVKEIDSVEIDRPRGDK